jgi:site-specific recombinase XerD
MAREPQKHWKASHKVKVNGQFIRLNPDEEKAQQLYHEIMAGKREIKPDTQVAQLILDYLEWSKKHHKARTHEWYRDHLESFSKHIGRLRLQSLKPFHVEQWIDKVFPNTKNGTTIGNAMRTVVRVCNWAKKSGRISQSPLVGLERPSPTHRDVYLMPEEYKALIAKTTNKRLLDLVVLMRETGCRPQEVRHIEARHFDRRNKCLVIPRDEAKGGPKGAKEDRVILLNDRAFEIVQRLALKQPAGKLLLNTRSQPWTANALNQQCIKLSKKLSFHIWAYAIRHTFCTDAIIRGVDIVTIAELLGHADLSMLKRIYQHVRKRSDHMREALRKATEDAA